MGDLLHQEIEALLRDPTSSEAANALRRRAREERAFAAHADAFAARGRVLADRGLTEEAIGSLLEAALVYEEDLEDLEPAAKLYETVLELESGHRRALFALGLILHDLGRWDELIRVYRRRLERCQDDGERTTLHLYTAEILSERLNEHGAAFVEVTTAARLAPKNLRIISRLQSLGELTGRIDEVAVVIGDLILHQDDPRVRAALSLRLAELHLGPLEDPQRALAYLRAAIADDGGNPEILSEVEDVFRERARFDELAEILEDAVRDRRVGPQRVRLERELSRIYELELGDHRRALLAMTRAAKAAPEDRELLDEVMRLGLVTSDMETVAATYEDVASRTDNALLRTYMRLKLGHIYAATLARPEEASRVYWAILEDDPTHKEARRRLTSLHEKRGEHAGLARLLELELAGPEGPGTADALRRLAVIRRDRLDDAAGAVEAWRRLLELVPDDPEARTAVTIEDARIADARRAEEARLAEARLAEARLAAEVRRAEEARRAEEEAARRTEAERLAEEASLARRVGTSVIESRADEAPTDFEGHDFGPESETDFGEEPSVPAMSAPRLRGMPPPPPPRDEDDQDELGSVDGLITAEHLDARDLEAMVAAPTSALDVSNAFQVSEVEIPRSPISSVASVAPGAVLEGSTVSLDGSGVGPARRAEQELDERITALEAELEQASARADHAHATELLVELVRAHERRGHDDRAFRAALHLAELETTVERVDEVLRLGRRARLFPTLVEAVDHLAPHLGRDQEIKLHLILAELEHEELHDVSAAVSRLARLAERAPDDGAIFERWTIVLEVSRRYAELIDVLRARALASVGTPEALALVRRAAQLADVNLEDPRGAAEVLLAYLARAPERDDLRQEAAQLLEKGEAWRELVTLLASGIERLEEAERADVRVRIARLYLDHLHEPALAEETLRLGLAERARDPAVLALLEEIYEGKGAWAELADVLERRLDVVKGARAKNAVRRKIATLAEAHLDKPDLALEVLADAAREDPSDVEVLAELERLRRARGDWAGVREALVLESRVEGDPAAQARALVKLAAVHADGLGDLEGAADHLREALLLVADDRDALEELARVEERKGDYTGALDTLRQIASHVEGAEKARVHVRIGELLEKRLEDTYAATSEYQAAYDADPHCLEAILALFRTHELEQNFAQAVELAARAATLSEDDRDKATLWRRAAELAHEGVGDELRAVEYYERALALDPDDFATAANLGELFLTRHDHARAYPALRKAADGLSDPERTAYLYNLAGQAAEKNEKRSEAIECYEAALVRAPRAFEPLRRLSELFEQSESWARAHELSAALLLHHEGLLATPERSRVYLRMARAKRSAKDIEASVRLARKAHQLADGQAEPLELLADVLAENGEAFEAAEALKKLAQILKTPHDKRNALHRAAMLLAEQADDVARAAAMLGEAQTFVPDDVEVAELLSKYRERLGDARGASVALTVPARLLSGRVRADLLLRAARISAGPARDRAGAKKLYHEALEIMPTHPDALGDLRVMLEVDGELEALTALLERAAQSFLDDPSTARDARDLDRKAAARALYEDALRVYRTGLRDVERTLATLRRLLDLSPDDRAYREDFARTLEKAVEGTTNGAALVGEAVAAWARLVEEEPGFVEGHRRLRALRMRAGELDLARLAEDLLRALGDAEVGPPGANGTGASGAKIDAEDPLALAASRVGASKPRITVPPHPGESTPLAALLTDLAYAPLRAFEDLLPEPRPKKRDLVGAAGLGIHVLRPLQHAADVMGSDVPPVYVRDDAREAVVPTLVFDEPALVVSLALASKIGAAELRFIFGRALSLLRPRALAIAAVPLDVLRDGLAGLAKPAVDPASVFADPKRTKKLGRALEKALPASDRLRIAEDVGTWLTKPGRLSLGAERAAVLRTAERSGLVASGSLSASIGVLKSFSEGRVDRVWHLPLLEFASTRGFADIVRRLG